MKNLLFVILFFSFFTIISCTENEKSQDINKANSLEFDPFRMDSINFYDFLKQAQDEIYKKDSTYTSYAVIDQLYKDSIELNNITNSKLIISVNHTLFNKERHRSLNLSYYENNEKIYQTSRQRFFQVLEAMKQMRYKMNYDSNQEILMEFNDNNTLVIESNYNPHTSKEWKIYLTLREESKDTVKNKIEITLYQLDSLISKLSHIRQQIL